eukprot:761663-Hanusia_phi.AAC.2
MHWGRAFPNLASTASHGARAGPPGRRYPFPSSCTVTPPTLGSVRYSCNTEPPASDPPPARAKSYRSTGGSQCAGNL